MFVSPFPDLQLSGKHAQTCARSTHSRTANGSLCGIRQRGKTWGKRNNVLQKEEGTCGLVGIKAEADGLQCSEEAPDAAYRSHSRDAAIIILK